jgi:hypothetical protein
MRPPALHAALPAALLLAAAAAAHGTYEASELEVHLVSDEGSDVIESYGGYDIQDLFLGFAHDPAVGAGAAGDGFYLRAELYGLPENAAQPPGAEWEVTFTVETPKGPLVRTLSTVDGAAFEHDFDALLVEVEAAERATHVQRAFVSFASAGLAPGDEVGPFLAESRASGDLRDVAPGGIPVPGTGGALEYVDPTQIDGRGVLAETVVLEAPTGYVEVQAVAAEAGRISLAIGSSLANGGQHVMVVPRATDGWNLTFDGASTASLPANGSFAVALRAVPAEPGLAPAAPLEIDVLTDVGGRSPVAVRPDGTVVLPDGATVAPAAAPPAASPGPGLALLGLALAGVALAARRLS